MCNLLDMRSDADENPWNQGFALIKHSLKLERDNAPHNGEFRIMLVVPYCWPVACAYCQHIKTMNHFS